jgi:hypothetical protein
MMKLITKIHITPDRKTETSMSAVFSERSALHLMRMLLGVWGDRETLFLRLCGEDSEIQFCGTNNLERLAFYLRYRHTLLAFLRPSITGEICPTSPDLFFFFTSVAGWIEETYHGGDEPQKKD